MALPKSHEHKHQCIIIDASDDFDKAALAVFGDDDPEKLHSALTNLVQNIIFNNPLAIIPTNMFFASWPLAPRGTRFQPTSPNSATTSTESMPSNST